MSADPPTDQPAAAPAVSPLLIDLSAAEDPATVRAMVDLHLQIARLAARDRGFVTDLWGAESTQIRRWTRRRRRGRRTRPM